MVIPRKRPAKTVAQSTKTPAPPQPPVAQQLRMFEAPAEDDEEKQAGQEGQGSAPSQEQPSSSPPGPVAVEEVDSPSPRVRRPPGRQLSTVPIKKSGEPRRDAADDVAFDPLLDIGAEVRTAVREPDTLTNLKPNELAAIIPSRPGVVLEYQEVKAYLLMHDYAIEQGLKDKGTRLFRVNVVRLEREGGFGRKDRGDLKRYVRNLVGATVEWNTPRVDKAGETTVWEVSSMVAHARFLYDKNHTLVLEWQYSDPLLEKLRLVGHYFRMRLKSLRDTRSFGGQALYLYLSRYQTFPGQRTDAKQWREWVPILTGKRVEDWDKQQNENVGNSWRYFHRDVVRKAVAEVNSIQTDYRVEAQIRKVGTRVMDLWFELHPMPKRLEVDEAGAAEETIVKRLVALDYKQRDAFRILGSSTRADILNALDYVEKRLALPTGHRILNKRAYFRTMLAKFAAGEVKPESEMASGGDVNEKGGPATISAYDAELRKRLEAWAEEDISTTLARGPDDERARELIRIFETEGLPGMHKQTQKAWATRGGIANEVLRSDAVKWLKAHVHPIPTEHQALLEMGMRHGLVKLG
jgi:hypothetical protein